MPVAVSKGVDLFLYCKKRHKVVTVDKCYRCPHFIKRDDNKIYCTYEAALKLGVKYLGIVERNPVVKVRDTSGNVYLLDIDVENDEPILKRLEDEARKEGKSQETG